MIDVGKGAGLLCGAMAVLDAIDLSWALHAEVERPQDVEGRRQYPGQVEFAVLGPLRVHEGEGEIEIRRGISRTLLIALLLALFVLPSPWGVVAVLFACVLEVVEITWGLRLARKRSTIGSHTLIGRQAVVVRGLDPTGQVTIDGERWKAHCATGAADGAKVVIQSISGLTLEVRVYTSVSDAEAGGAARSV